VRSWFCFLDEFADNIPAVDPVILSRPPEAEQAVAANLGPVAGRA